MNNKKYTRFSYVYGYPLFIALKYFSIEQISWLRAKDYSITPKHVWSKVNIVREVLDRIIKFNPLVIDRFNKAADDLRWRYGSRTDLKVHGNLIVFKGEYFPESIDLFIERTWQNGTPNKFSLCQWKIYDARKKEREKCIRKKLSVKQSDVNVLIAEFEEIRKQTGKGVLRCKNQLQKLGLLETFAN